MAFGLDSLDFEFLGIDFTRLLFTIIIFASLYVFWIGMPIMDSLEVGLQFAVIIAVVDLLVDEIKLPEVFERLLDMAGSDVLSAIVFVIFRNYYVNGNIITGLENLAEPFVIALISSFAGDYLDDMIFAVKVDDKEVSKKKNKKKAKKNKKKKTKSQKDKDELPAAVQSYDSNGNSQLEEALSNPPDMEL